MAETKVNLDLEDEEELVFQSIPHDVKDKTPVTDSVQTHTFTNFPEPGDSDEEGDKADLLTGDKKQPSFWTFEYYQSFFDVDTYQVLHRILGSMYPHPYKNYLQTYIRPNPDMYGPFWICTTLVFTTAIAGNMANYIQYAGKDYEWRYDFHKVTFAATAIFAYWWIVPTLLYMLLWRRGSQAGFSFLEIICVYGYSLAIYIPISILWMIQIPAVQWILVLVGMVLSGSVLVLTFWPAVRNDDRKVAWIAMAGILLFHGLLAAGFVLYFFHVPAHSVNSTANANVTAAISVTTSLPPVTTHLQNAGTLQNAANLPQSVATYPQGQQQVPPSANGHISSVGVGQAQQKPAGGSPGQPAYSTAQQSNPVAGQAGGGLNQSQGGVPKRAANSAVSSLADHRVRQRSANTKISSNLKENLLKARNVRSANVYNNMPVAAA